METAAHVISYHKIIGGETFDSLAKMLSNGLNSLPKNHSLVIKSHPDGTGYHTTFKSHIAKDKMTKEVIEYQRKFFISELRELPLCTYFKTQYQERKFELVLIIRNGTTKINEALCKISDHSIEFTSLYGDFSGSNGIDFEEIFVPAVGIVYKSLERIVDFAPHIKKGLEFK
jgi:hypothetical protein